MVDALVIDLLRRQLQFELLLYDTGKEAAYRVLLPAGHLHDCRDSGAARLTQQRKHRLLLGEA
jgi:hypothetical protein